MAVPQSSNKLMMATLTAPSVDIVKDTFVDGIVQAPFRTVNYPNFKILYSTVHMNYYLSTIDVPLLYMKESPKHQLRETHRELQNSRNKKVYNQDSDAQTIIMPNQKLPNYLIFLKDIWHQQAIILEIKMLKLKHLLSLILSHKINIITTVFGTHSKDIQEAQLHEIFAKVSKS